MTQKCNVLLLQYAIIHLQRAAVALILILCICKYENKSIWALKMVFECVWKLATIFCALPATYIRRKIDWKPWMAYILMYVFSNTHVMSCWFFQPFMPNGCMWHLISCYFVKLFHMCKYLEHIKGILREENLSRSHFF